MISSLFLLFMYVCIPANRSDLLIRFKFEELTDAAKLFVDRSKGERQYLIIDECSPYTVEEHRLDPFPFFLKGVSFNILSNHKNFLYTIILVSIIHTLGIYWNGVKRWECFIFTFCLLFLSH